MEEIMRLALTFIGTVALIMALVLMVSIFNRRNQKQRSGTLLMGGMFSFALVVSMSDPIDMGAGGIHDLRSLLIGAGVALLGPVVGLMTLATGLIMRAQIGGPGMYAGMVAMFGAYVGGHLWRRHIKDIPIEHWKKTFVLGGMISFHLIGLFLLPKELWSNLFLTMVPYYIIANILGAFLFNYLLGGELLFLSEAESSRIHANTDHLTGLLNRRGFETVYAPGFTNTDQNKGRALLYFDIDRFKSFNDTHGHSVGDEVLCHVADRISANLRPNDVFARLGGDEFVIVLNQIDAKEAKHIAERCRKVVANSPLESVCGDIRTTISIGAIWMLDHTEIDDIMDQADRALYVAKARGRNKVVFKHATSAAAWANPVTG